MYFSGVLIFKGLTARRLYKSFDVKRVKPQNKHEFFIRGKDKSLKQNVSDNGSVVLHKNAELCKTLHTNGKQRAL
jgi:hypothetical protein